MGLGAQQGNLFQSPSFRGGSTPPVLWGRSTPLIHLFQSPSFRGGSTPKAIGIAIGIGAGMFQSPSFRGGSTPGGAIRGSWVVYDVSIPFVSGREHSR